MLPGSREQDGNLGVGVWLWRSVPGFLRTAGRSGSEDLVVQARHCHSDTQFQESSGTVVFISFQNGTVQEAGE